MSRDAPSLDDIYGPGAEAADAFACHLQDLAERFEDLGCGSEAREQVYEAELQKLWQENRLLEGQLVSAGEEIERLQREVERPRAAPDAADIEQLASYYEHGADVDTEIAGELAQRDARLLGKALRALQRERTADEPSDDLAFPLDARVREVFGQTEGTIVAIDSRYEVECTDGKHRFYWHRQLERVAETKDAGECGACDKPGEHCANVHGICSRHGGRAHEPTSVRASNEQLAQALRNLRDVAHREVSPRYSAALDEAFTLADIALGEFDSEGEVSREADVGPGGGVRATHATGSAPSKPGAAEPPTSRLLLVPCPRCFGTGKLKPYKREGDTDWRIDDCPEKHVTAQPPTSAQSSGHEPYWTRSFWSPCREYLLSVHSYGEREIVAIDDNGDEWEATGPAQDIAGDAVSLLRQSSTKSACTCPPGLCCERSGAAKSDQRICRDAGETKGGQS